MKSKNQLIAIVFAGIFSSLRLFFPVKEVALYENGSCRFITDRSDILPEVNVTITLLHLLAIIILSFVIYFVLEYITKTRNESN